MGSCAIYFLKWLRKKYVKYDIFFISKKLFSGCIQKSPHLNQELNHVPRAVTAVIAYLNDYSEESCDDDQTLEYIRPNYSLNTTLKNTIEINPDVPEGLCCCCHTNKDGHVTPGNPPIFPLL